MSAVELSRLVKPRALPAAQLHVEASEAERAALAARFAVTAIPALEADVDFDEKDGAVLASGTIRATIEQPCAVSGDPLSYPVEEAFDLRFVPLGAARQYAPDEEVDLDSDDLDEITYDGETFDIGEAIAQSLALAIDPYREGPNAEAARHEAGITPDDAPRGALADALAALKKG